MNAAEMCQAFCPSAQTKVFAGGGIDHAVAPDGSHYRDLKTRVSLSQAAKRELHLQRQDAVRPGADGHQGRPHVGARRHGRDQGSS